MDLGTPSRAKRPLYKLKRALNMQNLRKRGATCPLSPGSYVRDSTDVALKANDCYCHLPSQWRQEESETEVNY